MCVCVAPPNDFTICKVPTNTRIPDEYNSHDADRALASYFEFLDSIDGLPTQECADAYVEFACSEAYPRCQGDADSGLSLPINTCYYQCRNFVDRCDGQLPGVDRPDCGQYSVSEDCTNYQLEFVNAGASLSAALLSVVALVVLAL